MPTTISIPSGAAAISPGRLRSLTGLWEPTPSPNLDAPGYQYWCQVDVSALTGKLLYSLTWTLVTQFSPAGSYVVDILVRAGPITTDFSVTNIPTTFVQRIPQAHSFTTVGGGLEAFTFVAPTHTATGMGTALAAALRATWALDTLGRRRMAFGLQISASSPTQVLNLVNLQALQASVDDQFTGLAGFEDARGRADECPVCGRKSTRDTWVRSGYLQMMVCPECYDEPDLVGRSYQGLGSERPGSGEG